MKSFVVLLLFASLMCFYATVGALSPERVPSGQLGKELKCETESYPPAGPYNIPKFVINLDLPPKDRWTEVVTAKKNEIWELLKVVRKLADMIMKDKLMKFIDKYVPFMAKTLPEPFKSEIIGIAQATGLPIGEVTFFNLCYEVFTVCTSLVAQNADGSRYHARNLDFGPFMGWDVQNHTWLITEVLPALVVELDFQRDNQTVFKSVNFAGYVGVLTGVKPHLFTLSLDERFQLDGGFIGVIRWLLGDRSAKWAGFLMRTVLDEASGYHQALNVLSTSKLLAPVYFILGGNDTDQGAVITRGRNDADVWYLGKASVSQKSTWFLVETNYDHWQQPPFFDDRRTPAIRCMDHIGQQNVTLAGLYNVLSSKPVLNKGTVHTTLMDVSTGSMETWIRDCPGPCPPW